MLKPIGQVLPNKFFRDPSLFALCVYLCGLSLLLYFKDWISEARLNSTLYSLRYANRPITRTIKNPDSRINASCYKNFSIIVVIEFYHAQYSKVLWTNKRKNQIWVIPINNKNIILKKSNRNVMRSI